MVGRRVAANRIASLGKSCCPWSSAVQAVLLCSTFGNTASSQSFYQQPFRNPESRTSVHLQILLYLQHNQLSCTISSNHWQWQMWQFPCWSAAGARWWSRTDALFRYFGGKTKTPWMTWHIIKEKKILHSGFYNIRYCSVNTPTVPTQQ